MLANIAIPFVTILALARAPATDAAPTRRGLPCNKQPFWVTPLKGLKNAATCTTFTRSDQIDDPVDGLMVGTINNWAGGRIPPSMRGIMYMEGNPLQSECFSTGTAYFNSTTGTIDIPMYADRTWSYDPWTGALNKALMDGTTFQNKCTTNSTTGRLNCFTTQWERRTDQLLYAGDFTADEIGTNEWTRGSNVQGFGASNKIAVPGTNITESRYNYNMLRIVDENGQRTSMWSTRYIPNINKWNGVTGQPFVHLKDTQEVPHRR